MKNNKLAIIAAATLTLAASSATALNCGRHATICQENKCFCSKYIDKGMISLSGVPYDPLKSDPNMSMYEKMNKEL